MKDLKPTDLTTWELTKLTTTLNKGYECEVKYASERVSIRKIKRKLLYKVIEKEDIKKHLIDNIVEVVMNNPTAKVELKREGDKIAIVLVEKLEIK